MNARITVPTRVLAVMVGVFLNCGAPLADDTWMGRWGSPNCGAETTQISLSREELDLSAFETSCAVLGATKADGRYEIRAQCHGEEQPFSIVLTVRVDGDTLSFTHQKGFEFDPKTYVRCTGAR